MTPRPKPRTWLPEVGDHTAHPCESTGETVATVGAAMLVHPKTLPADASIAQARAALSNEHVHMVLLTDGRRLVGTLTRTDLPPTETAGPALSWSTLVGRTVSSDATTTMVQATLIDQGLRRLAVVTADGSLLGLVCLNRRSTGFCSDADVAARPRTGDEVRSRSANEGMPFP